MILAMDPPGRRYIRRWITKWIKPDGRIEYGKRVLASGDASKAVIGAGAQQKKSVATPSPSRTRDAKANLRLSTRTVAYLQAFHRVFAHRPTQPFIASLGYVSTFV
jgi:hypothetical protein